ncbi:MAG: hypothetical protein HY280_06265 [Nitrospinae bacterium]|nr:hypothetical protein [Nitrospinota bacterium]
MKQITIRGVPEAVEKLVKMEAKKNGLSLNKAFIALLEKRAVGGAKGKRALHHDLDRLSGAWTKAEADEFEKNLRGQRKIDEELWKKT